MKKQKKYPYTVNLPFNARSLEGGFVPLKPGDYCEEGGGFWIILQGDSG
jgi:hypothetical protein